MESGRGPKVGHFSRGNVAHMVRWVPLRGKLMHLDTSKFIELLTAEGLSAREAEVALGVAEGRADKEIASKLAISVSAVRAYEQRAREKLGAQNRVDLAAVAVGVYVRGGAIEIVDLCRLSQMTTRKLSNERVRWMHGW